jgi:hypothetical protein
MSLKESPLHFNPLRPSRNHLAAVSWPEAPAKRSTDHSPFAYLHDPYVGEVGETSLTLEDLGSYNRDTQRWESPSNHFTMGIATKTRSGPAKSPPTGSPGESPDYDYVVDDACQ